jgi:Cofilin/tropomyosin-type actin-binding protein
MATLSDNAVETFDNFKLGKAGSSYLVFKLMGDGNIDIAKRGPETPVSWDELTKDECLPGEPCWIAYHFGYQTDGGKRSKLMLVQWIPSDCGIKQKMVYAMWSNTVKQTLNGIACVVQAGGVSDLDHEEVLEKASKFERDAIAA